MQVTDRVDQPYRLGLASRPEREGGNFAAGNTNIDPKEVN